LCWSKPVFKIILIDQNSTSKLLYSNLIKWSVFFALWVCSSSSYFNNNSSLPFVNGLAMWWVTPYSSYFLIVWLSSVLETSTHVISNEKLWCISLTFFKTSIPVVQSNWWSSSMTILGHSEVSIYYLVTVWAIIPYKSCTCY